MQFFFSSAGSTFRDKQNIRCFIGLLGLLFDPVWYHHMLPSTISVCGSGTESLVGESLGRFFFLVPKVGPFDLELSHSIH